MTTESRVLDGRYELGELLGFGGMAEVHRGRDTRLGREVAVKTLRADLARDPTFQSRFRREAQSAAGLNHPSIVAVYDTGEEVSGSGSVPYIVMEYVEGRTLRDILAVERRLPWRRAMEITAKVCAALDYSHRQGIVHRDIKPGNVMVTPTGDIKVMDFGIARAVTSSSATMTQTAAVMGTAQYLSPEQARGEPVDARSDVYSTGCLLYELLAGSPPFTGDSPVAVAYQHVREVPVPPSRLVSDLPPAADAVVLKAMAKNPVNRYQSAAEMRADCERAATGGAVAAPLLLDETETTVVPAAAGVPAQATLRTPPPPRRRRGLGFALLALAALAVLVGAFLVTRSVAGGKTVDVPDLRGDTRAQAAAELRDAGLTLGKVTNRNDAAPAGTVIDQDPGAGERVDAETPVAVVVSAGVGQVSVPNVTGAKQDAARDALERAGLKLGDVRAKASTEPAGTVIGQDPAANARVAPGTAVDLVVASGKTKVPDVVGEDPATARRLLTRAGFTVNTTTVRTDRGRPGTVIDQTPRSGSSLEIGSVVTITVALAPPSASPSPTPTETATPSRSPTPSASPSLTGRASATPTRTPSRTKTS
jgi:serine/threonine-protein kinase